MQTLAINGCPGATRELWEGVHARGAPALALRSLSAVGCKKLRACWLGMAPAAQGDLDRQEHLLQVGMYSPPASCDTAWREVPVSLSGAHSWALPSVSLCTSAGPFQCVTPWCGAPDLVPGVASALPSTIRGRDILRCHTILFSCILRCIPAARIPDGIAAGVRAGLRVMRLGLSGVRSLALALPQLASLDVNNVAELRCLELRTPALLTAFVQACK